MMRSPFRISKALFTEELLAEFENKVNGDVGTLSWDKIINKPQLADSSWKSPVGLIGDLPLTGNTLSDVRMVVTTGSVYKWDGDSWEFIGANDTSVDWAHLQNKPATYAPSAHIHDYTTLTSVPSTFVPSNHTHVESEIADLDKYTQAQINSFLDAKSETTHTHIQLHDHTNKAVLDGINAENVSTWNGVSNKADSTYVNDALTNKSDTTHLHDGRYYTESETNALLLAKQDTLISNTNIKTVNNISLLGSGNISIEASTPGVNSFKTRTGDVIPASGDYAASMITEDATHRFVTDAEKTNWNEKSIIGHAHVVSDVTNLQTELDAKALSIHAHDDKYYTETEIDGFLVLKSDVTHDHDGRYFTQSETNTLLGGKAASSHVHGNITSVGAIGTTANLPVLTSTSGVLVAKAAGTSAQYLNGLGAWATPVGTTYTEITEAEILAGTASTLRTITARRMKYAQDNTTLFQAGITAPTNTKLFWIDTN